MDKRQLELLKDVIENVIHPIIFHPNPKYDRGYEVYFINLQNALDYNYTIDGSNTFPKDFMTGEPIVTYNSPEEIVKDGWRLD